jgi:hypothetical protein
VQLCQPKAIGVFDQDYRSIGYINPHFNHRGADQNVILASGKGAHHLILFLTRHATMQQG